jgi:tripartite-type tricarboxylate transporter receptor subunit TctC
MTKRVAAALALFVFALTGNAQSFPDRPVRIVVPFGPGGLADITFRLVADRLSPLLGKQVLIENMPGAGGVTAANSVIKSKPDGHTLLVIVNGTAISKSLFKKLPYDPVTDLAPISLVTYFDLLVLVKNDAPYKSVADLVAAAKASPGKINFATINPGSTQNLSAELFKTSTGINVTVVPFKTSPDAATALMAGDVHAVFESYAAMKGLLAGHRIRALASTGARPFGYLPNLPTVRDGGINYEVTGWNALAAPAGTPTEVIAILNRHMNTVVDNPEFKAKMLESGTLAQAGRPEDLRRQLVSDIDKWAAVIKQAGIPQQ